MKPSAGLPVLKILVAALIVILSYIVVAPYWDVLANTSASHDEPVIDVNLAESVPDLNSPLDPVAHIETQYSPSFIAEVIIEPVRFHDVSSGLINGRDFISQPVF